MFFLGIAARDHWGQQAYYINLIKSFGDRHLRQQRYIDTANQKRNVWAECADVHANLAHLCPFLSENSSSQCGLFINKFVWRHLHRDSSDERTFNCHGLYNFKRLSKVIEYLKTTVSYDFEASTIFSLDILCAYHSEVYFCFTNLHFQLVKSESAEEQSPGKENKHYFDTAYGKYLVLLCRKGG